MAARQLYRVDRSVLSNNRSHHGRAIARYKRSIWRRAARAAWR